MLIAGKHGQGLRVHVEFLGRHLDPSFLEGDFQVCPKIGFISARRDIDRPHGFFDEGLTLRPLMPSVPLTKSLPSGTWTSTPRIPFAVGDRRCRRNRTSEMALALAEESRFMATPEEVDAASPLMAASLMVARLTTGSNVSEFRWSRHNPMLGPDSHLVEQGVPNTPGWGATVRHNWD